MSDSPLYGKFRGTVINNVDPMQIGRIQAMVPAVAGFLPGTWAMPCLPLSGINAGVFTVPMPGSGVWIEFERGDRVNNEVGEVVFRDPVLKALGEQHRCLSVDILETGGHSDC